jgi:hypothetical protein
MRPRIMPLTAAALSALAVVGAAYAAHAATGPRMGPPSTVRREAFHGYYDGHRDTYLNTDVSDKEQAAAMHVNYAPVLRTVPLASAPRDLPRPGQGRPRPARRLRLRAGRVELLAGLEGDDPDLEAECEARSDHERHADRPPRIARRSHRARDVGPAQLPDHQGRQRRIRRCKQTRTSSRRTVSPSGSATGSRSTPSTSGAKRPQGPYDVPEGAESGSCCYAFDATSSRGSPQSIT